MNGIGVQLQVFSLKLDNCNCTLNLRENLRRGENQSNREFCHRYDYKRYQYTPTASKSANMGSELMLLQNRISYLLLSSLVLHLQAGKTLPNPSLKRNLIHSV